MAFLGFYPVSCIKAINRLEWGAMIVLGIIGTVAVLLLYLPQYQFWREHKRIDIFHKKGILELSVSDIVTLKKDFFEGRGISQLVDKYLN